MTKAKSPTPSASTDASEQNPAFEAYNTARRELHNPKGTVPLSNFASLAARTLDLSYGVATVLKLIEADMLERAAQVKPLLSVSDVGTLLRLTIQVSDGLGEEAQQSLDWAYDYHTPEGKAERKGGAK